MLESDTVLLALEVSSIKLIPTLEVPIAASISLTDVLVHALMPTPKLSIAQYILLDKMTVIFFS